MGEKSKVSQIQMVEWASVPSPKVFKHVLLWEIWFVDENSQHLNVLYTAQHQRWNWKLLLLTLQAACFLVQVYTESPGVCPTTGETSRLLTFSKFGVGKGMATSNIFKSIPVLLSWTPKLIYLQSYPWSFSMRPVPSISYFCLPGLVICDGILKLWNNLIQ